MKTGDRKTKRASVTGRINDLCRRFNEPEVPVALVRKWLKHFDEEDRVAALTLLETVEFHSHPRLMQEAKLLHDKLKQRLAASGFDAADFRDVDFSREFTCKSGDLMSFIYRKANLIPSADFKTFDELIREAGEDAGRFRDRALVILDDYVGTGSQFIFHFVAQSQTDLAVLNDYRRVYLVCVVAHEQALERFRLLAAGRIPEVMALEKAQFPQVDFRNEEQSLCAALQRLDWNKVECVFLTEEKPLLAPGNRRLSAKQRQQVRKLLEKYKPEGYDATSYLLGHHTFFHGAPNSLPYVLLQFFKRVEDNSIYPMENVVGLKLDPVTLYDFEKKPRRR
jgi:hypothetical protein